MSNALRVGVVVGVANCCCVLAVVVIVGNFSHAYLRITLCRGFCVEAECKITFCVVRLGKCFFLTFRAFLFDVIYARFACFKAIVKVFCTAHCETVENYKCFVI